MNHEKTAKTQTDKVKHYYQWNAQLTMLPTYNIQHYITKQYTGSVEKNKPQLSTSLQQVFITANCYHQNKQ